ncbi:MAG TPA: hypothetical protein VNL96_05160 [Gemmatimonadaceae bacterium]|nr:hypothetical protein [Gemmatimonadaceae bacterium]
MRRERVGDWSFGRTRRFWQYCALLAALLAASGCYRYVPVALAPEAGKEVRVELSDEGTMRLAPYLGVRVEAVEGRLVEARDTSLVIAIQATQSRGGARSGWSGERFEIPRWAAARILRRELDRGRTWLASGLGIVGVIALGEAFGLGSGFGGWISLGGGGGRQ